MSIKLTDELNAATKKGKIAAAKQVFLEGDSQNVQKEIEDINSRHNTLNTKHESLSKTVQGIAATGGASTATNVTYDNANSGMTAENIQDAVDNLAKEKADSSDVTEQLDKVTIKDEDGTVVDTPFRYIQNEEFIFAKVDANDKLLFGIQWDGTPVFGKTSAVEDRLQSQVNLLADKITTILGDDDTTSAIDTLKELKNFFDSIDNTQTLTSILANLNSISTKLGEDINTKVDKEEGKSLIEDEVKECFRVIENEEFIHAVIDSDERLLFGIYRESGKPYFPLNEMYHVEQNKEFFAVWLDADDKVLLGIRRDGVIIGEIHAVNALKQVISQLQEKVDTIYYNTKEFLNFLSLQENQEYLAVETDADGKILSATNTDGSHYIHNAKSETIPEELFHIEDIEGRTEVTTDANDKILSYRDSEGKKHENSMEVANLDVSNINLRGNSVNNIQDALKANGFDVKHPTDWSDKSFIQIPEPHFAIINITNIDSMPTSKTQNKKAFLEFWDMQGNYFKKHAILNAQGNSSMTHYKKNIAVDFCEDEWVSDDTTSVKIGNWIVQDSFHLKAFYCSFYKNECPVSYKIWDRMCHTYKFTEDRPYKDYLASKFPDKGANVTNSNFGQNNAFEARCVPDGFPCAVYLNNTFWGIYSFQLKKHRDNYFMDKESTTNIHLDGDSYLNLFNGIIDWNLMEIRNPKPKKWKLYDMDGNKYDGDSPKELMGKYLSDGETINPNYDDNNESHKKSAEVKQNIVALSNYMKDLKVYLKFAANPFARIDLIVTRA